MYCTHNHINMNQFSACYIIYHNVNAMFSLSEVGKLEAIKVGGNYDTGQMFLHKVFGYRGVVLFPWLARVYDR